MMLGVSEPLGGPAAFVAFVILIWDISTPSDEKPTDQAFA